MGHHRQKRHNRRFGKAYTEWACILGFVTVAILIAGGPMGENASSSIQTTASGIGNPSELINNPIFRGNSGSTASGGSGSSTKGNNGLGNGYDPQPPGNPPVNDGEGTSPGNPGNRR